MNTTTDTPRTDAARFEALRGAALRKDCIPLKLGQELERELNEAKQWLNERYKALSDADAEVERLRELLKRAINEIEKTPFHSPRLTAFTAHRLAERYREEMTNTSIKPTELQEDDK